MQERNTLNISSETIVKTILFLILFWVLYLVKDLILVVLAAIVIASSIEPATRWFYRRKIKRLPAVIIIYLILGLSLAGFFLFFLPSVLNEATVYLNNLPDDFSLSDLWNPIQESRFFGGAAQSIPGLTENLPIKDLVDNLRGVISGTGEGVFKTANVIFGGLLSFVLMIVLSFYLAVQEDGVGNFLKLVTPIKHQKYVVDLWKRSQIKIGYWMQGQLLLAVIIGVLVYLGLTILGVQHALLLASLAAMFEIIPIFGPILAAIPAILISIVDGGVTVGLLVTGLYIIIHQFENHLLYPLVVKKIVGVSPIIVILSLVIGAKLAGFLGILLSVPISAALMEYVNDVEKNKIARGEFI
jgi:predicted PurR-regulated permease PerM